MKQLRKISLQEFKAECQSQGVGREDIAFKCVICGTVQSINYLLKAGAPLEKAELQVGFSCVGRWLGSGPHDRKNPKEGCDWTLGGLFTLHTLVVVDNEGKEHPIFELASPEEAAALRDRLKADG